MMFNMPDLSQIGEGLATTERTMNAILTELQKANELLAQIVANTESSARQARSTSQNV